MQLAAAPKRRGRFTRFLAPIVLAALVAVTVLVVLNGLHRSNTHAARAVARPHANRHLPAYWVVHPGDTLGHVAQKTGLTLAQLEKFNPNIDPNNLIPGARLKLSAHPAAPHPPAPPRFYTVKPGDSLGSIAQKTRTGLTKLEQLNPKLTGATLQPGEKVRLGR